MKKKIRITGPLWGESTGHRWIPSTKASDAEFWCFLWSALGQTAEPTIDTPVIWDAIAFIMTLLWRHFIDHTIIYNKFSQRKLSVWW